MHDWERSWLSWARLIVRAFTDAPAHFARCHELLGDAEFPHTDLASDPTLRWPGFLGDRWQPGRGVLFIGSVHAHFAHGKGSRSTPERIQLVERMAEANKQWRDTDRPSPEDDAAYLSVTRDAYTRLAPEWLRGSILMQLLADLAPRDEAPADLLRRAAWTNLAHCRALPRKTDEYRLQRTCSGKNGSFPIANVVQALCPALILMSVLPADPEHGAYRRSFDFVPTTWPTYSPPGYTGPLVYGFDGRPGKWAGQRGGQSLEQWWPEVKSQLDALP